MKPLYAGIFLLTLAGLSACTGGGDDKQPPPPVLIPANNQGRFDALHLAQEAREVCQAGAMTPMIAIAGQINRLPPGSPIQMPPPPNLQVCQQKVTELVLSLNTLYPNQGGFMYALGFLKSQGIAFGNQINAQLRQAGLPLTPQVALAVGSGVLQGIGPSNQLVGGVQQLALQGILAQQTH